MIERWYLNGRGNSWWLHGSSTRNPDGGFWRDCLKISEYHVTQKEVDRTGSAVCKIMERTASSGAELAKVGWLRTRLPLQIDFNPQKAVHRLLILMILMILMCVLHVRVLRGLFPPFTDQALSSNSRDPSRVFTCVFLLAKQQKEKQRRLVAPPH